IVEAGDQLGHRRLARARGPHERHRLAGGYLEAHVIEREHLLGLGRRRPGAVPGRPGTVRVRAGPPVRWAGVGEGDVLEADLAADAPELEGALPVLEVGAHVE